MKSYFLIVLLILSSCSLSVEKIHQKAVKHEMLSPLNNLVENYYCNYYHLPQSKEELIQHIEAFREHYGEEGIIMTSFDGLDLLEFIKDNNVMMAAYPDSVFIYASKGKIGCCVRGHPLYYLKHPEKYGYLDYDNLFHPTAYNADGKVLFEVEDNYWCDDRKKEFSEISRSIIPDIAEQCNTRFLIVKYLPNERRVLFSSDDFAGQNQCPQEYEEFLYSIYNDLKQKTPVISCIIFPVQLDFRNIRAREELDRYHKCAGEQNRKQITKRQQQTIQLAKEVDSVETPFTRIIYYYASLYSAPPQNKQQLVDYAKRYIKYTGVRYFLDIFPEYWHRYNNDTKFVIDDLCPFGSCRLVSFPDSCFLYSYRGKRGVVLYGSTPEEWCYSNQKHIYLYSYSPSFFDKRGKLIFDLTDFANEGEFNKGLDSLRRLPAYNHHIRIEHNGRKEPYKVFFTYTKKEGLKRVDRFDRTGRTFYSVENGNAITEIPSEEVPGCLKEDYINEIQGYLQNYTAKHPEVAEIRFLAWLMYSAAPKQ